MRNSVIFVGLGVALAAGTSVARAQTVETIVTPAAGPAVVAQAPVAVPPSGVLLPPASTVAVTAPVETVETVRTVTTTEPRRVHRRAVHPRTVDRVTTVTRTTTVRPGVVAAAPAYDELMRGPRLYDVVTPAPAAAPAVQPASRPCRSLGRRRRSRRRWRCRPIGISTNPIAFWSSTPTPTLPCRRSRVDTAGHPPSVMRRRLCRPPPGRRMTVIVRGRRKMKHHLARPQFAIVFTAVAPLSLPRASALPPRNPASRKW